MLNPIQSAPLYKNYGSFDKVAAALVAEYPEVFEAWKNGRSLSVMVSNLNKGKTTWWAKRIKETECLVELLGIDRNELGLDQKTGRHIVSFPLFPHLPALDLMREDCWEISNPQLASQPYGQHNYGNHQSLDFWLKSAGIPPRNVEWLQVQDEVEYEILTGKLNSIGRHDVLTCNHLRDVLVNNIERVRSPNPLILAIRANATNEDVQNLAQYRTEAPLLIISPWQMPASTDTSSAKRGGKPKEINNWTWTFLPGWRETLLQWVELRMRPLNDISSFSSQAAKDLLDKLDPSRNWFVTVKDVLVLCQAVSEGNERKLKAATRSATDVSELLSLLFKRDESNLDLMQQLIRTRWNRWDLAWAGGLPQEDWIAIASGCCLFETMLAKQLIVRGADGYDFQRPIVIRLLLRDYLTKQLNKGDLASWIPACFDNERRPLVDAALDVISLNELEIVAEQLMQGPSSVQNLGASEAIFTAIGRRIIRSKDSIGDELPTFADYLIKQLTWKNDLLCPWSRPIATQTELLEWITVCWAWSLQLAPQTAMPSNWQFPGWSSSLPPKLPEWLVPRSQFHNYGWENLEIPMQDFLTVAERWMASSEKPTAYDIQPLQFPVINLALAAAGKWKAESYWWTGLVGHPHAEQALLRLVESKDTSTNKRTALVWWPSLVQHHHKKFKDGPSNNNYWVRDPFKPSSVVLDWVMKQLIEESSQQALEELEDDDRKFLSMHPVSLSNSLKAGLLKSMAKNLPLNLTTLECLNFLSPYGAEMAEYMDAFLADSQLGEQAASCIWEWTPSKAERLLLKKKTLPKKATQNLIMHCPTTAIGTAIKLLQEDPGLLLDNDRLQSWARRHLPNARQHAQALIHLMLHKSL